MSPIEMALGSEECPQLKFRCDRSAGMYQYSGPVMVSRLSSNGEEFNR